MASRKKPKKKNQIKKSAPLEPWDQQENETFKAFAAFRCYRDMGAARTLSKVTAEFYKNSGNPAGNMRRIEYWSSKYRWVERCKAWDIENDRLERAEQAEAVREMKKRLAEQAMKVQKKGLQRMLKSDPEDLTNREALDYFAKGAEIESRNREVPDLKIEHTGTITTTDSDLDKLIANDPELRMKVNGLLKDIAQHPRRLRIPGEQREMDSR